MSRTVEIFELPKDKGWSMRGKVYSTAGRALGAVKRQDKETAARDGCAVTTIEWRPRTRLGAMVIKALAECEASA